MKFKTILIVLFASGLLCAVVNAQESREIDKTFPLARDGKVSIDTYKGSVDVDTWDKAEVSISARIEADGYGRYDEEKVRDTDVRIDASPGSVSIETDYRKVERRRSSFWDLFDGDGGNLPLVHYTIKMPVKAKLRIKDYKSEITVKNLSADLVINTYKGQIDVRSLKGGVDLETYKGEGTVDFASISSESRFETYKGELRIVLPAKSGFQLDAEVGRRGDFDSDFQFSSSTSRKWRSDEHYRGEINGGGPVLRLRTDKGSFRLVEH